MGLLGILGGPYILYINQMQLQCNHMCLLCVFYVPSMCLLCTVSVFKKKNQEKGDTEKRAPSLGASLPLVGMSSEGSYPGGAGSVLGY